MQKGKKRVTTSALTSVHFIEILSWEIELKPIRSDSNTVRLRQILLSNSKFEYNISIDVFLQNTNALFGLALSLLYFIIMIKPQGLIYHLRVHGVDTTSFYRFDVLSTSRWRRSNVMCWLGSKCVWRKKLWYKMKW